MADLPRRPEFTNIGDGAPNYHGRQRVAQQSVGGHGPFHSSNPRRYHPHDNVGTAPVQSPSVPPWRRDRQHQASQQSWRSDLPPHHPQHQGTTASADSMGLPPVAPAFSSPGQPVAYHSEQAAVESDPDAYAANPDVYLVSPRPSSPPAPPASHAGLSDDSGSGRYTAAYTSRVPGYGGLSTAINQPSSSFPCPAHHSQFMSRGSPMSSAAGVPLPAPFTPTAVQGTVQIEDETANAGGPAPYQVAGSTVGGVLPSFSSGRPASHLASSPAAIGAVGAPDAHPASPSLSSGSMDLSRSPSPPAEASGARGTGQINTGSQTQELAGQPAPVLSSEHSGPVDHAGPSGPTGAEQVICSGPISVFLPAASDPLILNFSTNNTDSVLTAEHTDPTILTPARTNIRQPKMQNTDNHEKSGPTIPAQTGEHNQPAQSESVSNLNVPMQSLHLSDSEQQQRDTNMTTLTNLQVNLGACARSIPLTSLTSPDDIAKISTAWSGPATGHAITIDAATFRVDLTILIPAAAACPAEVLGHHLDAIEALVNVLQGDKDKRGLSVDNLWRLGGMKHGLALSSWCVEVMGKWMGAFVGRLKKVGTWLDGPGGMEEGVADQDWERALNPCLVFGWEEYYRAIAARLAYLCGVEVDQENRETTLVKPSGTRLEKDVCGKKVSGAILAARKRVLEHVFADAEGALRRWTARLAHHPCTNMVCNTNRLAALNAFLVACGLCPRREVTKSLAEIISALELITSADADAVDGKLA